MPLPRDYVVRDPVALAMRKVVVTVVGAAVTLLVLWGILHLVITPVHPAQPSPENHFDSSCSWCHIVSRSAAVIE